MAKATRAGRSPSVAIASPRPRSASTTSAVYWFDANQRTSSTAADDLPERLLVAIDHAADRELLFDAAARGRADGPEPLGLAEHAAYRASQRVGVGRRNE